MDELSQIDLAFCVDLTRSMEPFIAAARRQMVLILGGLRSSARADLRVAVVGYRDHDPDPSYVPVEVYPFTADDAEVDRTLARLQVGSAPSNTDAAEAVLAGLAATMKELQWRQRAFRIVVLIGDGPPHASGADAHPYPDRFPGQDPSGYSTATLANALETAGLFLHALAMLPSSLPAHDGALEAGFSRLARSTGGTYRAAAGADAAIAVVEAIGRTVFGQMSFDRRLFEALLARSGQASGPPAASAPMGAPPSPGRAGPRAPAPAQAYSMAERAAPPPPAFAPGAPSAAFGAPGGPPPSPSAEEAAAGETDALAAEIAASPEEVQAAVARLKKRGLLPGD